MRKATHLVPFSLPLLLAACLGGGGGSGGGGGGGFSVSLNDASVGFTERDDIDPNTLVEYTPVRLYNVEGNVAAGVFTTLIAGSAGDAELLVAYDQNTEMRQARISGGIVTPFTTDFEAAPEQDGDFLVFFNPDPLDPDIDIDVLALYEPAAAGDRLDHLTFGIWGIGIDDGAANYGAATWGTTTPAIDMPVAGAAVYTGQSIGTHINLAGAVNYYVADSTLAADFAAGLVTFSTANTAEVGTGDPQLGFDISQIALVNIAGSAFAGGGSLTTVNGMAGGYDGNFYGPTGQEAGGRFNLTGGGQGRYLGSFGGKP